MFIELIHGDCLKEMKNIPDGSIDLVVTDPPYRCISGGLNGTNKHQGCLVDTGNDGKLFKHNSIKPSEFMPVLYKVLKPQSHAYIMTNTKNLELMLMEARLSGFYLHNLLVWIKNNCTVNRWYMKNAEYILFLKKGKAVSINNKGNKTAHEFNNPTNKAHPTEKPIDLMSMYIENSSNYNDIVLDPFMGSGTTGVACKNLNRNFIGIELDETYFNISKDRIEAILL